MRADGEAALDRLGDLVVAILNPIAQPSRLPKAAGTLYAPPGTSMAAARDMLANAALTFRLKVPPASPPLAFPVAASGPVAVLKGSALVMSIPLAGELGEGRRMVMDLLAWDRVKLLAGAEWTLKAPGSAGGAAYVVSYRKRATAFAGDRDGTAGVLVLARFIMGATDGQVVSYRDGDTLNLTRANLTLEERKDHWDRHRA